MKKILFIMMIAVATISSNPTYAAKKTIGILIYDGVLSSDITAPAEVFGVATKQSWFTDYDVKMISINNKKNITAEEGLTIATDTSIDEVQNLDALIVPSTYDMNPLLNNKKLIQFIQTQAKKISWLGSNCSGALLLAEAGLLDGKKATTWAGGEADFQKQYPKVKVQEDQNYVIDGNIITSNGSVVSYTAAIKLLSLMSSEKLAKEVFDNIQLSRLVKSY
ncbi:MAG: DJ-1/PfpI family protein [Cellvibrionaceae bacterium]